MIIDEETLLQELRKKYSNVDLRIEELCRNYKVSTDLIRKATNLKEFLDSILKEYIDRLEEIPGKNLVESNKLSDFEKEKLRSLIMFATQAVLLKENAEIYEALEKKNRELMRLTASLRRANKRLREMNSHYLNMLSFVSHELRSPLISVLGFAELLQESLLGELNEEQRKAIQVIMKATKNLVDMIQNYLDLAKIEGGRMKLDKESIDVVEEVINPVVEEMKEQFAKKGMEVKAESKPERVKVFADKDLLRIVFGNLFSNAVKYGKRNSTITYRIEDKGDHYQISVFNEGRGVSKKDLPKIFGKFIKLKDYEPQTPRGAGLGLFNTKYIVEEHGGKIWAESEKGKWFKMTFTLPKNALNSQEGPKNEDIDRQ